MTGSGSSDGDGPDAADRPTTESMFLRPAGAPVYADHGDAGGDGGEDELDSEFAPQPRKRLGKLTIALAALLVAGAGFLGGVQVQQHEGSSSSSNPFAAAAARRGTGTGTGGTGAEGGTGGFGGAGGFAGRGGTGGTGTGTGGTGTGSTGTSSIPAVIGQIVSVSGDTMTVKNLGGQTITVTLSGSTAITQSGTAADLKPGQNVTVSGTTGSDGTVTATAVGTH